MKKLIAILSVFALFTAAVPVSASASGGLLCTPYQVTIISDTSNTVVGDGNAVSVTPHPAWTASISDSTTWIWKFSSTALDEVVAFEKGFTVVGAVLSAQLDIASDNSYEVFIDNVLVASDPAQNNFQLATQDVHNLTANITSGAHTLRIEVKNLGTFNATSNPGGLLYKLVVDSEKCSPYDCNCDGTVTVTNQNSSVVRNSVSTISSTGGNTASGGRANSRAFGSSNVSSNAHGGNGGSVTTGNSFAQGNVFTSSNTNFTRIRRR
jgi:hypothetical protein